MILVRDNNIIIIYRYIKSPTENNILMFIIINNRDSDHNVHYFDMLILLYLIYSYI